MSHGTPAIEVIGLGKAYRSYASRWSRLAEWVLPGSRPRHELRWVVNDISFQVPAGCALGIVGGNGAGKSTLLKMIAGTVSPSCGEIRMSGRVAALLELGMGFHPDFSGRQNVLMAGQLLGLSSEQILELMPAIESFAEIGDYIDQPVRVYSSGMQVRLAFSLATVLRPDVLIVDEALSVGDTYFQHKSFDRIRQFRREGTTLLIVSHDRSAIQSICDEAILLDHGRLIQRGTPESVMDFYNGLIASQEKSSVRQTPAGDGRLQTQSGSGEASIESVRLLDASGREVQAARVGEPVRLEIRARVHSALPRLVAGYMIKDCFGQAVYGTNTHHLGQVVSDLQPGACVAFEFDFAANLGVGSYSLAVALTDSDSHLSANYEWRDLALVFKVLNLDQPVFSGCAWLPPTTRITVS